MTAAAPIRIGASESNDLLLEWNDGDSKIRLVNMSPDIPDGLTIDYVSDCLREGAVSEGGIVITYNGANGRVIRARVFALAERPVMGDST